MGNARAKGEAGWVQRGLWWLSSAGWSGWRTGAWRGEEIGGDE